jgi:hypothetical protein
MCCLMVLIGTNVRERRMHPYGFTNGLVIRASVRTEMVWLFLCGSWARNHEVVQGSFDQCPVMAIGSGNHHSQRHASSVTPLTAFGSPLAAIGGIGAGRGSTERGPGHHPIHPLPFPGHPFHFVLFLQSRLPDAPTPSLLFPEPKAIRDRRARSWSPWEGIPLDAGTPHRQNG